MRRRRFNPHRFIQNLEYWSLRIVMLLIFWHWLGQKIGHDFGLDNPPAHAAQANVCEERPPGNSPPSTASPPEGGEGLIPQTP